MNKLTSYKHNIFTAFIGVTCLAFCTLAVAGGGGGGGDLDSKVGLERAADNFLLAFILLSKNNDTKLSSINGVEYNPELSGAVDSVEYQTNDSLWNYIIMIDWNFTDLPQSTDRSSAEKAKFRNDYIAKKQQAYNQLLNRK